MQTQLIKGKSPVEIRTNESLAVLHTKCAELLRRIAASRGEPSLRDCAMAGIYANQLDRRKSVTPGANAPKQ